MVSVAGPAPSMFAVFRKRDFSLLWLAQLVSTAGSSLTDLAAGIWVYRETGSALAVGQTNRRIRSLSRSREICRCILSPAHGTGFRGSCRRLLARFASCGTTLLPGFLALTVGFNRR